MREGARDVFAFFSRDFVTFSKTPPQLVSSALFNFSLVESDDASSKKTINFASRATSGTREGDNLS